jgi:hypothetical protein
MHLNIHCMGQHIALPNKRLYFFFTLKLCQKVFFSKNQALSIEHGATGTSNNIYRACSSHSVNKCCGAASFFMHLRLRVKNIDDVK